MQRRLLILFILISLTPLLFSQKLNLDQLDALKMRSIGPAGMSGRVTTITARVDNPNIIYVGTASGGLWRSNDGGIKWEPLFDDEPVQSIGAVAIDQDNPDLLWAGTGEGNPRNSFNSGKGIYKSLDGGKTWKFMGLENTKAIHRILIDPHNSEVVYVAALGSAWGPNPERGVYKTTDGGETWEKVLYVDDTTGCADLVMDPRNPNKLIAAMWEYNRKPWFFNSGGDGSGLYVTYDGGKTWKERTDKDGLPKGPLGRIGLAIARSDPNIVYALVESKEDIALYRSTDGGHHWKKRGTKNVGNRPFYYADIYVDPENENRIYSLWSVVSRSEDGGKSFETLLNHNEVHPDHHAFWIHPHNPDLLINGNDGGLNISRDRGETWQFIRNLPVGQFYHINYDMETPYNVYGGMQDNGSWVGPTAVWQRGGIRNHHWQELLYGDGFDVVPQPGNSRFGYAMYQGGSVYRFDRKTGETHYIQPVHPKGKELRFNWNAAIAPDPFNNKALYFGSQYLHHSTDKGKSWNILSPDLTTNDSTKQNQAESGGLTIDATRAENFTTITCIAPSPLDSNVIFVGTDDGNVQVTKNKGETWTNVSDNLPGLPKGSWIQQIVPSKHQSGEFFLVANNYRRDDWSPYAYHTTTYGTKWKRIATPDEVEGHCWSIVQDPVVDKLLFLGTDYGLYFSLNKGATWQKWDKEFPSAPVRDLKIHPREHDLIVATFGRSIYIMDDIRPLRQLARDRYLLEIPFVLFEGGTGLQVSYKSYPAPRFIADEGFKGTNDHHGVSITFWLNEKSENSNGEKSDSLSEGGKKMFFVILDEEGDTVRNFSIEPDTGLNRIRWYMHANGTQYPTNREVKENEDPTRGLEVMPGIYKVMVHYKNHRDSTMVKVLEDPRQPYDRSAAMARKELFSEHEKTINTAFRAYEQLKKMAKTINRINGGLDLLPDSTRKKVKEQGQAMLDSIEVMKAFYFTPPDFEGYDHVTVRLSNLLFDASTYITSADGAPGANAHDAMETARQKTRQLVHRLNHFRQNEWADYRSEVENLTLPLFNEMESIEMEE